LLLYSSSKFTLEILEYCEASEVIKREQHYLDLLKPEYNILIVAGSSQGYKHDDEALAKISAAKLGR
jgi:group I intron endonuclease